MLRRLFIGFLLICDLCCVAAVSTAVDEQRRGADAASVKPRNSSQLPPGAVRSVPSAKPTRYIEHLPVKNRNALQKQTLAAAQGIRVYRGCIKKLNVFKSLFYKADYGLYQGDKWIACLKTDNILVQEHLKNFLGTVVTIKGMPEYINKDPFLVICVKEIYGEGR